MNGTAPDHRSLSSRLKTSWLFIAIGGLATLVYVNILPNTFVYDDWQQIVDNQFLRRPDGLWKIFTTGVRGYLGTVGTTNSYRPLMNALFYLGYRLFGLNPAGYHLLSILLHVAVSLLVYAVIARLSRCHLTAAVAALLFAVHPAHVEAVAWISAYPELLLAFFGLLAIWLYLRAEDATGAVRFTLYLLMGPAVFLALLAKETAVTLPLLLAGFELLLHRAAWRARLRVVWPCYGSIAVGIAAYLAARISALEGLFPVARYPIPFSEQFWTAVGLYFRYAWLLVWPLQLHPFYYLPTSRRPLEPVVLAGLLSIAATALLAWQLYRRRRPELLALPLYLLPLAPSFALPWASVGLLMAERYVYLPSVAFCWLLAAAWVAVSNCWGYRRAAPLLLLLLAGHSARTVAANVDWRDEIAFYRRAIAASPGFPRAYLNLGEALIRRNRLPEALQATQEAARLSPTYPDPQVNLGLIYWRQGDSESAILHFRHAAALAEQQGNPFVASRALTNLAVLYRGGGRLDEAISASRQALRFDPEFAGGHNNLGYALLIKGQLDEGMRHLRLAVSLDPTLDVAYSNLGLAFALRRQWDLALECFRQAGRLNPRSGEVHARIGEVHLARGDPLAARREFVLALRLEPYNERAQAGIRTVDAATAAPTPPMVGSHPNRP